MEPDSGLRFAEGSEDIVEGWLVPFGGSFNGRDSYGTYASPRTNFCLDWFSERPFLYHHGRDEDIRTNPIGRITAIERRDKGLWMQAQLDAHNDYYNEVKKLVKAGALGLSSGAMSHLVEIDQATGEWLTWPLVEGSGTPTESNLMARITNHSFASAIRSAGFEDVADKLGENDVLTDAGVRSMATEAQNEGVSTPDGSMSAAVPPTSQPHVPAPGTRANMAGAPIDYERSFEDIRDDITELLNPMSPYGYGTYSYVVATFPTFVVVCRTDDDECSYWQIAYTLDDANEPVLGDATQVEQVFIPVAQRSALTPLTIDAGRLSREAAAVAERTKDLCDRRLREGRVFSTSNKRAITDAIDKVSTAVDALKTLIADTDQAASDAARAADPLFARWQAESIEALALI